MNPKLAAIIECESHPTADQLCDLVESFARPESRGELSELDFKGEFTDSTRGWAELLKDILTLANSSGGIIVFGVDPDGNRRGLEGSLKKQLDAANVLNKLCKYTNKCLIVTSYFEAELSEQTFGFLLVKPSLKILVFDKEGNYPLADSKIPGRAFGRGVVYVRTPGGNSEASQSELDELIDKIVKRSVAVSVSALLARIEKVAHLPPETELIAHRPGDATNAYILQSGETGIPVRITKEGESSALPLTEVLDASTPFSSVQSELVAQVRHWQHGDRKHRAERSTLIRWFLQRSTLKLDGAAAEFCLVSAGYKRGCPMYWAGQMERNSLREWLKGEIQRGEYPMNSVLPYIAAGFFWDEREQLLQPLLKSPQSQAGRTAKKVIKAKPKEFLTRIRFPSAVVELNGKKHSIRNLLGKSEDALLLFEQLLAQEDQGEISHGQRMAAHQCDILAHVPSNEKEE